MTILQASPSSFAHLALSGFSTSFRIARFWLRPRCFIHIPYFVCLSFPTAVSGGIYVIFATNIICALPPPPPSSSFCEFQPLSHHVCRTSDVAISNDVSLSSSHLDSYMALLNLLSHRHTPPHLFNHPPASALVRPHSSDGRRRLSMFRPFLIPACSRIGFLRSSGSFLNLVSGSLAHSPP